MLVFLLSIGITFGLILGLPIALGSALLETDAKRRWRTIRIALFLLAGYVAGGTIGWAFRPEAWQMPLWETAYAAVHSDIYGHAVESVAERVFLYFIVAGALGTTLAGVAASLTRVRTR